MSLLFDYSVSLSVKRECAELCAWHNAENVVAENMEEMSSLQKGGGDDARRRVTPLIQSYIEGHRFHPS